MYAYFVQKKGDGMSIDTGIIESAVKVLVRKEIEEAGERVAARLCVAFGNLAKSASQSTDIRVGVERTDSTVVIRIEYDSIIRDVTSAISPDVDPFEDEELEALSSALVEDNIGPSPDTEESAELMLDPEDIEILDD